MDANNNPQDQQQPLGQQVPDSTWNNYSGGGGYGGYNMDPQQQQQQSNYYAKSASSCPPQCCRPKAQGCPQPCRPPTSGGGCMPKCGMQQMPKPACPPDYYEPKDTTNAGGPMSLINLAKSGAAISGNAQLEFCGQEQQKQAEQCNYDADNDIDVEEKARQKAELKIQKIIQDMMGAELRRKEREILEIEKQNEALFKTYRAVDAFKGGRLNEFVFKRVPIRDCEIPEEEIIQRIKRLNVCGKKQTVAQYLKEQKKQTLLRSLNETTDYLNAYANALERSQEKCGAADSCGYIDSSPFDTVMQWMEEGKFTTKELCAVASKAAETQRVCSKTC